MKKLPYLHIAHQILVLVMVFATGIVVSCTHNSTVDRQLTTAENLMAQHPDSALALLESIEHKQMKSHNKASYGLLINRARLLCGKTISQDNFIYLSFASSTC